MAGGDAVLAALRLPDALSEQGGCGGAAPLAPALLLVRDGSLFRPRMPAGRCGLVRPEVKAALAAATYDELARRTLPA